MLGAGRPAKTPSIDSIRELTRAEVKSTPRAKAPAVKALRESHHNLARLCAMGLRNPEIKEKTGYGIARISVLRADPAFKELVESYRADVNAEWKETVDEYYETVCSTRMLSAQIINDKLQSSDPDELPLNQLVAIHADAADRTGYPKRTVAVNVNVDFAARLDQAIKRSSVAPSLRVVGELPSPELKCPGATSMRSDRDDAGTVGEPCEDSGAAVNRHVGNQPNLLTIKRRA